MGKIKKFLTALFVLFFSMTTVSAVCNVEEQNKLNGLAVNVRASYEIITKEIPAEGNFNTPDGLTEEEIENYKYYRDYFKIHITNVTEEMYIKVTNKRTEEVMTFDYQDVKNGEITIEKAVFYEINNYIVEIYTSNKTNCPNQKIHTVYVTTPMYNILSELNLCEGIEEYYMCHKYLSVDVTFDDYAKKMSEYRKGLTDKNGNEITKDKNNKNDKSFFEENRAIIILVSAGIILVGASVTLIVIKRRRSTL